MAVGYPVFDPIVGGTVSLCVIYQYVDIARENTQYLADSAHPKSEQEEIKQQIREHSAIHGIHDYHAAYDSDAYIVDFEADYESGDLTSTVERAADS